MYDVNIDSLALECGLFYSEHSNATERLICCTDIIGTISSFVWRALNPQKECENPEQTANEIIKAYSTIDDIDDFFQLVEKYIDYDDAIDVTEGLEEGRDMRNTLVDLIREKQVRRLSVEQERARIIPKSLALALVETACKAVGFSGIREMGNEYHTVNASLKDVNDALIARFQNEEWYRN